VLDAAREHALELCGSGRCRGLHHHVFSLLQRAHCLLLPQIGNGADGISDIEHVGLGSRRMDGQAAEGRGAELGKRSINTSRLGTARVDGNAAR
jgi:hypothetical protein